MLAQNGPIWIIEIKTGIPVREIEVRQRVTERSDLFEQILSTRFEMIQQLVQIVGLFQKPPCAQ